MLLVSSLLLLCLLLLYVSMLLVSSLLLLCLLLLYVYMLLVSSLLLLCLLLLCVSISSSLCSSYFALCPLMQSCSPSNTSLLGLCSSWSLLAGPIRFSVISVCLSLQSPPAFLPGPPHSSLYLLRLPHLFFLILFTHPFSLFFLSHPFPLPHPCLLSLSSQLCILPIHPLTPICPALRSLCLLQSAFVLPRYPGLPFCPVFFVSPGICLLLRLSRLYLHPVLLCGVLPVSVFCLQYVSAVSF
jgi:hypothetical protein